MPRPGQTASAIQFPRLPVVSQQTPVGSTNPNVTTGRSAAKPGATQLGPTLTRQHFGNRQANQMQASTAAATAPSVSQDDSQANVLRGVSFTGGTAVTLSHGLGRGWTSYRIERVLGAGALFHAPASGAGSPQDPNVITLTASASCTADARVW